MRLFRLFLFLIFLYCLPARAVDVASYGIQARIDSSAFNQSVNHALDSMIRGMPMIKDVKTVSYLIAEHNFEDKTSDFYLLLSLCFILGVIKAIDQKYFYGLWRAFVNPTLGNRQLKDVIQSSTVPNLLMNLFFTISLSAYVYYLLLENKSGDLQHIPDILIFLFLLVGMTLIYSVKYALVNFTGWVFNIRSVTDQYNFNVFLINKVIGIALLPFVISFAFLNKAWLAPATIISFALLLFLLLNRYIRSWNIFGPFFHHSRFHFFMYLCAFEILPMAILMKIVVRMMLG